MQENILFCGRKMPTLPKIASFSELNIYLPIFSVDYPTSILNPDSIQKMSINLGKLGKTVKFLISLQLLWFSFKHYQLKGVKVSSIF